MMTPIFEVMGSVQEGKKIGRKLDFPTANIIYDTEMKYLKDGVYAALVNIDEEAAEYPAMLNQGRHPTFPEGQRTIEVHLFDYQGDLYGHVLRIRYMFFLREERRFESVDALKEQLKADASRAREMLLKFIC